MVCIEIFQRFIKGLNTGLLMNTGSNEHAGAIVDDLPRFNK